MKISKVVKEVNPDKFQRDLKSYSVLAYENGAKHVKIVQSNEILVDFRAYMKCIIPKCPYYGTNAQCPPHGINFEDTQKLIDCYSFGILVAFEYNINNNSKSTIKREEEINRKKLNQIVSNVEAKAFYDGYYFAIAFAGGPCKGTWCVNNSCQALEVGKGCRFPLLARPSMEGCGIDAFKMAANAGWDVYPIGSQCEMIDIPHVLRIGLILIN